MDIMQLLESFPLRAEAVIQLLRFTGILSVILSILTIVRVVGLTNSLTVAKASQFIQERKKAESATRDPSMPGMELQELTTPQKMKKPLIVYSISEGAKDLMDKVSVEPTYDDDWHGAPGPRSTDAAKNNRRTEK